MSARNPTAWNEYIEMLRHRTGFPVLASELDKVLDDQQYVRDAPQLLFFDAFDPIEYESSATFGPLIRQGGRVVANGTGDICQVYFVVRAYSGGTVKGAARVTGANGSATQANDTITGSTPTWYGVGTVDCETDGAEEGISLGIKVTSGNPLTDGHMWLCGFAGFAVEL